MTSRQRERKLEREGECIRIICKKTHKRYREDTYAIIIYTERECVSCSWGWGSSDFKKGEIKMKKFISHLKFESC